MELGTNVTTHISWWKRPRSVAVTCLLVTSLGLVALQSGKPTQLLDLPSRNARRRNVVTNASEMAVPLGHIIHGHDQDVYRDFMVRQWAAYAIPTPKSMFSRANELVPKNFGLCDTCVGAAIKWQRLAGISYVCLDYNKDMRNDMKGRYRNGHVNVMNSEQHFREVKARYMNTEARAYLQRLEYVQELRRYKDTSSEQNSGFVAYHPGMKKAGKEILVVVQGSMSAADGQKNFQAVGTDFAANVLTPLGVKMNRGPASLREHLGYAEIVKELYPQVMEAVATAETRCKCKLEKIVVTGHSLGSSVGAGLLKVIDDANEYDKFGVLFAQPNSFKLGFMSGLFTSFWKTVLDRDATMQKKVINVHNLNDPVVIASETSYFVALGKELSFKAE